MTADFELELKIKKEHLGDVVEVFKHYLGEKREKPAYFCGFEVNGKLFDINKKIDDDFNTDELIICLSGPYGSFVELNDVDIFRDLAERIPNAAFTGKITGTEQYGRQDLDCELKEKRLTINTYRETVDEVIESWITNFMKKFPIDDFKDTFKITGVFTDLNYACFLHSVLDDGLVFEDMDFDDFITCIEMAETDTALEEDEFDEVIDSLEDLDIVSFDEYLADYEDGEQSTLVYDPIEKSVVAVD